jgi:hypothetical protein
MVCKFTFCFVACFNFAFFGILLAEDARPQQYRLTLEDGETARFQYLPVYTAEESDALLSALDAPQTTDRFVVVSIEGQEGAEAELARLQRTYPQHEFVAVRLSRQVLKSFRRFLQSAKNHLKEKTPGFIINKLEEPEDVDRSNAKITGLATAALASAAYINVGLPAYVFTSILTVVTLRAYYKAKYRGSIDNIFAWRPRGAERGVPRLIDTLFRSAESLTLNLGVRFATGPVRQGHSLAEIEGVLEVATIFAITATMYPWAQMQRSEVFKESPKTSGQLSLQLFLFTSVVSVAKMAGWNIVEFGYGFALPDLVLGSGLGAVILAMKTKPKMVEKISALQSSFREKVIAKPLQSRCQSMGNELFSRLLSRLRP